MKFSKDQINAPFLARPQEMRAAILKWWLECDPNILMHYNMTLLGEMAESARLLAWSYGIKNQPEVCAFANLMWLYGANLDDEKAVSRVLQSSVSPERKIEELYTKVPDRIWDRVSKNRDEARWTDIQLRYGED